MSCWYSLVAGMLIVQTAVDQQLLANTAIQDIAGPNCHYRTWAAYNFHDLQNRVFEDESVFF